MRASVVARGQEWLAEALRHRLRLAAAAAAVVGISLALAAQRAFDPPHFNATTTLLFAAGVALAATALVWAWPLSPVPVLAALPADARTRPLALVSRLLGAAGALAFAYLSYKAGGDNHFDRNVATYWLLGMATFLATQWQFEPREAVEGTEARGRRGSPAGFFLLGGVVLATAVAAFFRFFRLDSLPPELNGDVLVNVLDVRAILDGKGLIYYPYSDGAAYVYAGAALAKVFGQPADFLTIKLVGAIAGVLTVIVTFLLAREALGRPGAALLAALLVATSHWAVVISRGGLKMAFTSLFTALVVWLLIRALKSGRRNDFLLCGLALGLSLHNYTAVRILPFLLLGCIGLAIAVRAVAGGREGRRAVSTLLSGSLVLYGMALIAIAPLARYAVDHPKEYWRPVILLGPTHESKPLSETLSLVLANFKEAALMFNWTGDVSWPNNIPFAPALDDVTAVLFPLGLLIVLLAWLRRPGLMPVYLFAGLLAMMGPTIMATVNPGDNPAFGRASGAIPFVFVFAALPLDLGTVALKRALGDKLGLAFGVAAVGLLLAAVSVSNYRWYFNDYPPVARSRALNYTEMADAIQGFVREGGDVSLAFLVSFPHWADTRAIAVELGQPKWSNNVLDIEQVGAVQALLPGRKLYLLNPRDEKSLAWLTGAYPEGRVSRYVSRATKDHDFLLFYSEAPR